MADSPEETSAPRFSSMEVDRICNAYESGFGRGTNYDEIAQPYADGCPEAQAYQQGYMLARKRRAQKAPAEPHDFHGPTVSCRCGWIGHPAALVGLKCPKCGAEFK